MTAVKKHVVAFEVFSHKTVQMAIESCQFCQISFKERFDYQYFILK